MANQVSVGSSNTCDPSALFILGVHTVRILISNYTLYVWLLMALGYIPVQYVNISPHMECTGHFT